MAEPKTRPTGASVDDFINSVDHAGRREDGFAVLSMLRDVTGQPAEMWGPSIVGFGRYPLSYADGSRAEWPRIGFSPRKANMVLYVLTGDEKEAELLSRLGKHKTGNSCLYLGRLKDVDQDVLRRLCEHTWSVMDRRYPA